MPKSQGRSRGFVASLREPDGPPAISTVNELFGTYFVRGIVKLGHCPHWGILFLLSISWICDIIYSLSSGAVGCQLGPYRTHLIVGDRLLRNMLDEAAAGR